jgi:hypothetical protein
MGYESGLPHTAGRNQHRVPPVCDIAFQGFRLGLPVTEILRTVVIGGNDERIRLQHRFSFWAKVIFRIELCKIK